MSVCSPAEPTSGKRLGRIISATRGPGSADKTGAGFALKLSADGASGASASRFRKEGFK